MSKGILPLYCIDVLDFFVFSNLWGTMFNSCLFMIWLWRKYTLRICKFHWWRYYDLLSNFKNVLLPWQQKMDIVKLLLHNFQMYLGRGTTYLFVQTYYIAKIEKVPSPLAENTPRLSSSSTTGSRQAKGSSTTLPSRIFRCAHLLWWTPGQPPLSRRASTLVQMAVMTLTWTESSSWTLGTSSSC